MNPPDTHADPAAHPDPTDPSSPGPDPSSPGPNRSSPGPNPSDQGPNPSDQGPNPSDQGPKLPPADGVSVDPALAATAPPEEPSETPWRRLSVRMLAVHPVMEVLRALPALVGVLILGVSQGGAGHLWGLIGVGVVVGLGLVRWATTTYRVTEHQVQVRRGLLRRNTLTVPRDRVRSVDLTAHFMHRLLGLQRLAIGTGQADQRGGAGLRLDALSTADAHQLRDELLHQRRPATGSSAAARPTTSAAGAPPTPPRETELARLQPHWFRYAPFSLYGLFTIFVTVGLVGQLANEFQVRPDQFGPVQDIVDTVSGAPLGVSVAGVVAVAILLIAFFSTLGYLLTFWGFRLTRTDSGTLHVTRGLITTRAITIEERRLRGVELSEPALLRMVGGARLAAITTGVRAGTDAQRGGSLLCPPAPRDTVLAVAERIVGAPNPLAAPLTGHGPAATRRRYTRAIVPALLLFGALLAGALTLGWPAPLCVTAAVLLVLAVPLARQRARNLGHTVVGPFLVARQGALNRRHSALADAGVVGWRLHRSYFQRRAGVVTLSATTAGGRHHYDVLDAPAATAVELADRITPGLLTPFLVTGAELRAAEQ